MFSGPRHIFHGPDRAKNGRGRRRRPCARVTNGETNGATNGDPRGRRVSIWVTNAARNAARNGSARERFFFQGNERGNERRHARGGKRLPLATPRWNPDSPSKEDLSFALYCSGMMLLTSQHLA